MAGVRVTTGKYSHEPGDQVGIQVNVFGLTRLQSITGEDLAPILAEALQPAYENAYDEWAVLTGASRDSLEVAVTEIGPKLARAALQAGGDKLISDPRNTSHKDYAPFLEFNGSPSGSQAPGAILRSVFSNDREIREHLHTAVAALIQERLL